MAMPSYDTVADYLNMSGEWVIDNYIAVAIVLALISVLLAFSLLRRRRRGKAGDREEKKGGAAPHPPAPPVDENSKRDRMMSIVMKLEAEIDNIEIESLGDEERKWYNKVKMEIEGIKKNLGDRKVEIAKRHLSSLELYIKTLELHMFSR
jgi:hypothetical protein